MPIFGADHTEPEGSNFSRNAEDFATLRKAVKEVDAEFKRNFKYFKGMVKPMEEVCVAVNHFYDGPHTTTEYRTRGSRLTNMLSRISVAIEAYDSEYGSLMQMVASYGEKLKSVKGLIDDRFDKLAEFNAKKKAFTSLQAKEGKDPAKVKVAQDKFQTAKDAFDASDAKAQKELADIFVQACSEFEECYVKFLRVQSTLFVTAGAALGGADLPTSTIQSSVLGSDESISKTYKGEQKELEKEKKREKKEEKRDKKEDRRKSTRRGTVSGSGSQSGSGSPITQPNKAPPLPSRNDVFEPSNERNDHFDEDAPPPSLSTPPMEHYSPSVNRSSLVLHDRSLATAANGASSTPHITVTTINAKGSASHSNANGISVGVTNGSARSASPPPLPSGRPAPPPASHQTPDLPIRSPSSDIMTDLELIGREPNSSSNSSNKALPPLPPPNASGPPSLPPLPPSSPPSLPTSSPTSLPPVPSHPTPGGGPPALPPGRSAPSLSNAPPMLPNRTHDTKTVDEPKAGPPPSIPQRTAANGVSSPPPLPRAPSSSAATQAPPPLPSGRYSAAPGSIQPLRMEAGAPPPLPASRASFAPGQLRHVNPEPSSMNQSSNSSNPSNPSNKTSQPASTATNPPNLPRRAHAASAAPAVTSTGPPAIPTRTSANTSHSSASTSTSNCTASSTSTSNSHSKPPPLPPTPSTPKNDDNDQFNPRANTHAPNKAPKLAIPSEEVNKYGLIFKREDPNGSGHISGQQAFGLFSRSKLPTTELAQIWEIADQDKDGKLTKDEFIIAMWYINSRLRQQMDSIPKEVHPTLVLSQYPNHQLPSS